MITPLRRSRKRFRVFFSIVFGGGVLALLVFALFFSKLFSIRVISCDEGRDGCSPDVLAEMNRHLGENALTINPAAIASKIKKSSYLFADVTVRIQLPQTLQAILSKRIVATQLTNDRSSSRVWFADREGVIIGLGERSDAFPIILLKDQSPMTIGDKFPDSYRVAEEILDALKDGLSDHEIPLIQSNMLTASLKEGSLVRFSLAKPPSPQLAALQLVLNKARIKGIHYQEIDLRFLEPVVKE